ncbi:hypothetical protein GCM10010249_40800 [Streptomyces roseolilacinus]|uniref:Uncharacterized protein n=1 Tax=Streptomyces roseolilacinus TaxID=66904 RepID=A0A918B4L9_9ACTN|nr:hypothetical protein GCM10010249_40800 [Streptomyces roseolilacinus]
MVPETVAAVAALGGAAVVQAAGTDAWNGVRARLARWLGRGDGEREHAEARRLDAAAAVLRATADVPEVAGERRRQEEAHWRDRFLEALAGLSDDGLAEVERELRALLRHLAEDRPEGAAGTGIHVEGNVFSGIQSLHIGNSTVRHEYGSPESRP